MTTFVVTILVLYFVPSLIAAFRGHHNMGAIIALNVFLGWSVIGWIAALVWSFTNPATVVVKE